MYILLNSNCTLNILHYYRLFENAYIMSYKEYGMMLFEQFFFFLVRVPIEFVSVCNNKEIVCCHV